ncbi:RCC1 domain-containing protein [Lamprocystis purpurea]|uniref:RCC1 domain-containing protein n=1 Tax=Lamprocystis purpurea TaxID=61598 RepID=UPI0003818F57|nr:CARDB domain-containing protein [Lamprocystis purpurea]
MLTDLFRRHSGPRGQRAPLVLVGLLLTLSLVLGQAAAGLTAPDDAAATNAAALRAQVAAAGWVTVRVDLRASEQAAAAPVVEDDLEQTVQDLLFALPAGSYDGVQRTAGSARLTLRVDPAGLDALLGSPWAATVAAADTAEMQRLAAGWYHSLVIKTDDSLWAWGLNNSGQLGDGTTADRVTPIQVLTGVAAVAAGAFHTLALKTDGSLAAWGWNFLGQLGDGTTASRHTPIQILTGVTAMSAGGWHTLAVKTDGSLWAWGWNIYGQLGDGTTTDRHTPIQVMTGVAAVSAGGWHTLVIKTDGSLWAWGDNSTGALGDDTTTNRYTPVQVLTGVAAMSAGDGFSLALKTDGSLWAWGLDQGWLGDGTTANRLTPVQVMTGVAAVSAGSSHALALKTDGSLWAWGSNFFGEIGDGTTTWRYTPVQVLTGVAAVSAGNYDTLAIKTTGSLWAWGWNIYGELGDGSTTDSPTPVPVVGFEGPPTTSDADFTVTNVSLNPSAPLAGGTFNASITVKNRGTQAGNPGRLRVWTNQPQTQSCNAPGDTEINLADLPAGANQTVRISLPAGTAGYKTLRTFIDSECLTAEPDEANNQSGKGYRVFDQPIADFAVTAIDLTPNRPAAGRTFSAAVTVKNRGTAPGDAGTLALWVDQPDVPACGAVGDAAVAVGPLAAGATRTLTLDGLPAGTAAAKSLRAFIDHTCVSTEAYDANNQRVKPYTVVP